jgi:hypothetical protein
MYRDMDRDRDRDRDMDRDTNRDTDIVTDRDSYTRYTVTRTRPLKKLYFANVTLKFALHR